MRLLLASSALSLMLAAASPLARVGTAIVQLGPADEESAVYSALIREMYVKDSTKLILIFAQTVGCAEAGSPPDREDLRQILQPVSQSAIDDYKAKCKEVRPLKAEFDLPVKYTFLAKGEWDEMFREDNFSGWESLYQRYPGAAGVIRVSEIGFNAEGTQALLYVERGCGSTCGEGGYVLLIKQGGIWRVEKRAMFMAA